MYALLQCYLESSVIYTLKKPVSFFFHNKGKILANVLKGEKWKDTRKKGEEKRSKRDKTKKGNRVLQPTQSYLKRSGNEKISTYKGKTSQKIWHGKLR